MEASPSASTHSRGLDGVKCFFLINSSMMSAKYMSDGLGGYEFRRNFHARGFHPTHTLMVVVKRMSALEDTLTLSMTMTLL